jgi:hypothetical protein
VRVPFRDHIRNAQFLRRFRKTLGLPNSNAWHSARPPKPAVQIRKLGPPSNSPARAPSMISDRYSADAAGAAAASPAPSPTPAAPPTRCACAPPRAS